MNKKSVIKHSAAVHITNKINLLQRRAWNILLANSYDKLLTSREHHIGIKELMETLGLEKSENTNYIKETTKALISCVVEWNTLGKDNKNIWEAMTLLSRVKVEEGILTYAYDSSLAERLYNPSIYARISLSMQNKFDSKHSLALYELAVDYFIAKRKYGETPFIDMDAFRKLMGFDDDEYREFKILKRDVIKPAIEEINEKSDLLVEVEYKRASRKVSALKLNIQPNSQNKNPLLSGEKPQLVISEPEEKIPKLFERLQSYFCLSPGQAKNVLNTYEEDYIIESLTCVEKKHKRGEIKNIGAYTLKALKEDFRNQKSHFDIDKEEVERTQREEKRKKEHEEKLRLDYERYLHSEALRYKKTLSHEEMKQIEEEARRRVEEKSPQNDLTFKILVSFEIEDSLAAQAGVLPFEEWKNHQVIQ